MSFSSLAMWPTLAMNSLPTISERPHRAGITGAHSHTELHIKVVNSMFEEKKTRELNCCRLFRAPPKGQEGEIRGRRERYGA